MLMKNLVFLFVFTAWSFILQAQLNCTNFNPNTFESTINVWDWTDDSDENWIAYIFETASNSVVELPLASPFHRQVLISPIQLIYLLIK